MNPEEKSDEEVVALVRQGDLEAFGILVARYEPKLQRYARRFLSDKEDVLDLVQEVFIKAYTNLQSFDLDRRFSPWIYRVAHNEFLNFLKSSKSRKDLSLFDADVLFPHPVARETADREARIKEARAWIEKSLGSLDAKYREPVVLYYFEDMDYQEIADILQVPVSTVGVRLTRARSMLQKNNEKYE